jgi:chromosome segregation ATPase
VTSSPAIVRRALEPAQRRERLKERLKAASAKVEPAQPTPQSPAEARASALSLIAQLRQELEDSRKLASSLSHDLAEARAELARASEEGRSRSEEAGRLAGEVAARAKLIEELGQEMACLEAERDDVLLELRAERKEAEVLQATKADLERQLGRREAELSEALSEEERLVGELESNALELKRAQSALGSLTEERDQLAHQVGELTREHEELRDSQKALDEIHRALASARIRVQGTVGNL